MAGNTVELVGNLTRTPELRFTPSGAPVANFGLAVNRRWQNRQTNEWEEQTSFFDVVCWRDLAENVAESLDKGIVMVVGRLDSVPGRSRRARSVPGWRSWPTRLAPVSAGQRLRLRQERA